MRLLQNISLITFQGPSYFRVDSESWFHCPADVDATIQEATLCGKVGRVLARRHDPQLNAFVARHVRLDNIQTLTLNGVRTEDVAGPLSFMTRLICLTICPTIPPGSASICPGNPTTPITLPHLESLRLTQSPHNKFYGGIVAPSLLSLELNLGSSPGLELRDFTNMIGQISSI